MQQRYGILTGPAVIVHGGAGAQDPKAERARQASLVAEKIARMGVDLLLKNTDPLTVVVACLKMFEADEIFNAGFGSALQADGVARLTAAVMDGRRQSLSGVMHATQMLHPSELAAYLQNSSARVLAGPGPELLARTMGTPLQNPVSQARALAWANAAKRPELSCDTVGVVVRTADGQICAGTSTGGRGNEFPGRVSDAATVAGNYASAFAGISCTGIGEEIVDDAVAARIDTRCRDGQSLEVASRKAFDEAVSSKRSYGWIALDAKGAWALAHTSDQMIYALADGGGQSISSVDAK